MTDPTTSHEVAHKLDTLMHQMIPAVAHMNIHVTEAGPGFATATVPAQGNGNHFGVIYAGVQFTVAEVLGGLLALATFDTTKYFPLVKNIEINFLRMATTDLCAQARIDDAEITRISQEVHQHGKSDFIVDALVTDTQGQTIATTHGIYQLRAFDYRPHSE